MKTLGRIDKFDIPEFGLEDIPVKIDTGANRSSIHCSKISEKTTNGVVEITFHIPLDSSSGINTFRSKSFFKKRIRSSSGHVEERYVIITEVIILGSTIRTSFSLTDRADMKYPVLIGRKLLKSRYLVDVSKSDISFNAKKNP